MPPIGMASYALPIADLARAERPETCFQTLVRDNEIDHDQKHWSRASKVRPGTHSRTRSRSFWVLCEGRLAVLRKVYFAVSWNSELPRV